MQLSPRHKGGAAAGASDHRPTPLPLSRATMQRAAHKAAPAATDQPPLQRGGISAASAHIPLHEGLFKRFTAQTR